MSQEQFSKVLDKLVESFDDFKERLIRIEENVRDVKSVKNDVEELKIKNASLESKANSSHKRIDKMEQNQTWLWRTIVAGFIGVLFYVIQSLIN